MTARAVSTADSWRRVSPLATVAYALWALAIVLLLGVPTLLILAVTVSWPVAVVSTVPAMVLVVLVSTLAGWLVWRRTRYEVGPERFRLRSGVLIHRELSLARDRIRAVDITADPVHRLFGLARVQIGTGEQTGEAGSAVLSPVRREEAAALRAALLPPDTGRADRDGVLARFDPAWIRYAPVSLTAMVVWAGCYIVIAQQLDWLIRDAGPWLLRAIGVPLLMLIGIAGPILIAVVAALALYVENWWNYRLERESGALLIRRGLVTTRATTLQESRVRGLEILEPLGTRLAGAAEIQAISTGLVNQSDHSDRDKTANRVTLLPYAPRPEADRVAAAVLGVRQAPTTDPDLLSHPSAARARRLRWAALAVVGLALASGALALIWSWGWIVLLSGLVVAVPAATWMALDAYRALGHQLDPAYLVTRSGLLVRRTAALERDGIIGWTLTQSFFQRRAHLATLTATTAAGSGGYRVVDVDATTGLELASEATPGLLADFLRDRPAALVGPKGTVHDRPEHPYSPHR